MELNSTLYQKYVLPGGRAAAITAFLTTGLRSINGRITAFSDSDVR